MLISLARSVTKPASRPNAKNKSLLKISKSGVCCPHSGPDEGRTRRHETLGRQCGGRESIDARDAWTNDAITDVKSRGPDTPKLVSRGGVREARRRTRWPTSPVHRG
ncbi:MAG: hypothetical protein WA418_37460, partial [Bradyrhizobium sp.]